MNSATGYHSPLWADAFQCEGVVDTHTDHIDRRIAADTAAARAVWERGCVAFEAAQAAAGVSGWCPHLAGVHGPGGYLVPVFDFGADAPRKSAERSALVFALAFEEAELKWPLSCLLPV